MKRILIVSVIACSLLGNANAQIAKGKMLLGGGVSYEKIKSEARGSDDEEHSYTFNSNIGYFVSDGLAVGLNLNVAREEKYEPNPYYYSDVEIKRSSSTIGPFIRFYQTLPGDKFAFFAQGFIGFVSANIESSIPGDFSAKTKFRGLDAAVSPGFTYFFNDRWAAELVFRGIAYTMMSPKGENEKETKVTIGLDSLTPALGLRVYLGE